MPEFASPHSYQQFEQSVKTKARFVPEDATRDFLKTVLETAEHRLKRLRKDEILFRAQRGGASEAIRVPIHVHADGTQECEEVEVENGVPHSAERMIPKAEFVGDGRVNPRGIPCLYLADTCSAVISEMRPWIGLHITIAQFRTVRDCVLVDCSVNTTPSWRSWESINLNLVEETEEQDKEPDAAIKEKGVWGDIGFAFSKPVTHDEPHLDYIPTQILAEAFQHHGYDGIIYKSLLDKDGKNIALFDPKAATLMSRCLYETQAALFQCVKVDPSAGYRERANSTQPRWPESISSRFARS